MQISHGSHGSRACSDHRREGWIRGVALEDGTEASMAVGARMKTPGHWYGRASLTFRGSQRFIYPKRLLNHLFRETGEAVRLFRRQLRILQTSFVA